MLEIKNVSKSFGGLRAVDRLSLTIREGEIYGLIGPNGAGKTTLLNLISGIYKPDEGEILFNGVRISGKPPYSPHYRPIARTFQIPKLWRRLDVLSNLMVAGYGKSDGDVEKLRDRAYKLLRLLGMEHVANYPASKISGGQAKLLEFGRALMTEARLLILDEPFAGVSPALMQKQMELVIKMKEEKKISAIIVSHIINKLTELVDRIGVMHGGRLIAEGEPRFVLADTTVIEAYMGGSNVAEG